VMSARTSEQKLRTATTLVKTEMTQRGAQGCHSR
jgi:hypothetical protein